MPRKKKSKEETKVAVAKQDNLLAQIEKGLVDPVGTAEDVRQLINLGSEVGLDVGSAVHHATELFNDELPLPERVFSGMKGITVLTTALAVAVEEIKSLQRRKRIKAKKD